MSQYTLTDIIAVDQERQRVLRKLERTATKTGDYKDYDTAAWDYAEQIANMAVDIAGSKVRHVSRPSSTRTYCDRFIPDVENSGPYQADADTCPVCLKTRSSEDRRSNFTAGAFATHSD